jgi:phage-related protein
VPNIPASHIVDAHKLTADGRIDLFEMTPAGSTGILRFKADNDVEWRGNAYTGLPVTLSGEDKSATNGSAQPRMIIGQPNINLSFFKPLVYDEGFDGATIVKISILLADVLANNLIRQQTFYRVKRVESYSRTQINLILATLSDSLSFSMPFRQYFPPDFPAVQI